MRFLCKHTEIGSGNSSSGTSRNANAKEVNAAQQSEVRPREGLSLRLLSDIKESAATGPRPARRGKGLRPAGSQALSRLSLCVGCHHLIQSLGNALQSVP